MTNVDTITDVLYVMAISKYNPSLSEGVDKMFLEKVADIFVSEPVDIKPAVASKMLWSLYAIGYKNVALLDKLSGSISANHQHIPQTDLVNIFKAYAHFDYLHIETRDGLVKTAIRNSQEYTFDSLASICESLSIINYDNKTLL